jgi:hypothetical protein
VGEEVRAGGKGETPLSSAGRPGVALRTAASTVTERTFGAMLAKLRSDQTGEFDR